MIQATILYSFHLTRITSFLFYSPKDNPIKPQTLGRSQPHLWQAGLFHDTSRLDSLTHFFGFSSLFPLGYVRHAAWKISKPSRDRWILRAGDFAPRGWPSGGVNVHRVGCTIRTVPIDTRGQHRYIYKSAFWSAKNRRNMAETHKGPEGCRQDMPTTEGVRNGVDPSAQPGRSGVMRGGNRWRGKKSG